MKFCEIFDVINGYAPTSISDELVAKFGGYDNSGIICETLLDVKTVVFALDLTSKSVEFALKMGAQLIVTHHPAIYMPIKKVGGALQTAIANNIGVISMHLNFDACEKGVDYYLANGIGAKDCEIVEKLSNGGYGRIFTINEKLSVVADRIKKQFKTESLRVYGDGERKISRVASFCGAGLESEYLELDCDLFVSSDIRHHLICQALENKKAVIDITHYASENYGLTNILKDLSQDKCLEKINFYYFNDERFL